MPQKPKFHFVTHFLPMTQNEYGSRSFQVTQNLARPRPVSDSISSARVDKNLRFAADALTVEAFVVNRARWSPGTLIACSLTLVRACSHMAAEDIQHQDPPPNASYLKFTWSRGFL